MERKRNKSLPENRIINMIHVSLFAAVIAISAQIAVPIGQIPFTLQTMAIFTASALLGLKKGMASVTLYILLGAVGLPVFTGFAGGVGVLAGATGGYIIGFLPMILAVGFMTDKFGRKIPILLLSMIIGLALCYFVGSVWFAFLTNTSLAAAVMLCVVPYLFADILKIFGAALLVSRLDKIL